MPISKVVKFSDNFPGFVDFELESSIRRVDYEYWISVNYHQFIIGLNNVLFINIANMTLMSL